MSNSKSLTSHCSFAGCLYNSESISETPKAGFPRAGFQLSSRLKVIPHPADFNVFFKKLIFNKAT